MVNSAAALRTVPVRWRLSGHARRLLTLALAGLLLAVLTRRPEFAGLAAPALLLLATLVPGRPTEISVQIWLTSSHLVEDTEAAVNARVGMHTEFSADLRIEPASGVTAGRMVTLAAGDSQLRGKKARVRTASLPFVAVRWGNYQVGKLTITLRDRYRLTEGQVLVELPSVDCRPRPARLDSDIVLTKLPSRLGERPARARGEGAEFAGVREFVPGDRQRRINWPATTRHGTLHLSTFAAERIQHVVVIADATTDLGEPGSSALDLVLRGSAGVVARYLASRDRVGLVVVGPGRISWLGPGQGRRHFQRLMDLLVASPGGWERTTELARLPRAALPPGALILVFSPLLDVRFIEAIRDLRERGFSVIVVDVLNAEPGYGKSRKAALTRRIWRLDQEAIRFSLTQIGVPVAHWDGVSSLDEPLAQYLRRAMVTRR